MDPGYFGSNTRARGTEHVPGLVSAFARNITALTAMFYSQRGATESLSKCLALMCHIGVYVCPVTNESQCVRSPPLTHTHTQRCVYDPVWLSYIPAYFSEAESAGGQESDLSATLWSRAFVNMLNRCRAGWSWQVFPWALINNQLVKSEIQQTPMLSARRSVAAVQLLAWTLWRH